MHFLPCSALPLQLASHGVLASGKPFPQEYLHIIRFRPDQKIVSIDSWNVRASCLQPGRFPEIALTSPSSHPLGLRRTLLSCMRRSLVLRSPSMVRTVW